MPYWSLQISFYYFLNQLLYICMVSQSICHVSFLRHILLTINVTLHNRLWFQIIKISFCWMFSVEIRAIVHSVKVIHLIGVVVFLCACGYIPWVVIAFNKHDDKVLTNLNGILILNTEVQRGGQEIFSISIWGLCDIVSHGFMLRE